MMRVWSKPLSSGRGQVCTINMYCCRSRFRFSRVPWSAREGVSDCVCVPAAPAGSRFSNVRWKQVGGIASCVKGLIHSYNSQCILTPLGASHPGSHTNWQAHARPICSEGMLHSLGRSVSGGMQLGGGTSGGTIGGGCIGGDGVGGGGTGRGR